MVSSQASSQAVQMIPIDKLKPNPWNRTVFDPAALDELVASIRTGGIEEPLIVRPQSDGIFEIASGHRRWLAAQKVGLKEVPCIARELENQKVAEMNIEVNLQRENIPPLEMARMVRTYIDEFKKTQRQAAKEFGKSQPWVSDLLSFLEISPQVLENIRALIIGWDTLVALKKVPEDIQLQVSKELKEGRLKPTDIARRCQQLDARGSKGSPGPKIDLIDPLANLWEPLQSSNDFAPDVSWDVQYKMYSPVAGQGSLEGWVFFAKPIIGDPAKTLAFWFRQMAVALEGGKPQIAESQVLEQMQELAAGMTKITSAMGEPRLPQNELEEKELEEIARRGNPSDVLSWIYGKEDVRAKSMSSVTWQEYGQTPQAGVQEIIENIRTEQAIERQRAKGKII